MNISRKLLKLREEMSHQGVQGYIVPCADEYQGEYVPACAQRLTWLTEFTGSAGFAVVLDEEAVVMSDGRYTIQLQNQVDEELYMLGNSQETKIEEWLVEYAPKEAIIAYDPKLHTASEIQKLEKAGIELQAIEHNLIDQIWADQPTAPASEIFLFSDEIAGRTASEKIKLVAGKIRDEKADAFMLTLSDSIAWLLNIRGSDVSHIPVALSYAIIHSDERVDWFIDPARVNVTLDKSIRIFEPAELLNALTKLGKKNIGVDDKRSSIWFKNKLEEVGASVINMQDPCILPRACKTKNEQQAMREAHIRDGVALVKFLKWFEEQAPFETLTELSVEAQLEKCRAQALEFKEPSFSTIAGYGANGAIVHYRADEDSNTMIKLDNLLLLDSGAQYSDGTTDITRTLPVGEVSEEMKHSFTLVLKGHINLAQAVFEEGTTGQELDKFARAPLQAEGKDYAHGTGHGVGCYLSVHEEAASISPRGMEPLREGMVISNEPGYYETDSYGIRIENLVLVQKNKVGKLFFETITLAPISTDLIVSDMLSEQERLWLNDYHARVLKTLSPLLNKSEQGWLEQACAPL